MTTVLAFLFNIDAGRTELGISLHKKHTFQSINSMLILIPFAKVRIILYISLAYCI